MPHHHHFQTYQENHKRRDKQHDKDALNQFQLQLNTFLSAHQYSEKDDHPRDAVNAWRHLEEGNRRFASGKLTEYLLHLAHEVNPGRRQELGLGQHPFAVILTCSDSRVSPEIIFDQGLGDLFVVRTAGNVPDGVVLGSLEYGLLHLKAPLLVVLGHSKCGAVTAALDFVAQVEQHPGPKSPEEPTHIGNIIEQIKPAASEALRQQGGNKDLALPHAVKKNALLVSSNLPNLSSPLKQLFAGGTASVITAVYDIDTGLVHRV